MPATDVLVIEPRHGELARARAFIVDACSTHEIDDDLSARLALAAGEVCTNIIDHGGARTPIELSLLVGDGRVDLTVRDETRAFDPRSIPAADVSAGVQRPIGGLGWYLVRHAVDHIDYRRAEGRNTLTLAIDLI